MPPQKLY